MSLVLPRFAQSITPEERAAVLDKLRPIRQRLREESDRVGKAIAAMESLCEHDWQEWGHVGPYTMRVCPRCKAEDCFL